MSDNIANLKNYIIQLQQVETALENDPENEDLQKLYLDLSEVIKLTKELMSPDELALVEDESLQPAAQHSFKPGDYVMAPWSEDGQFYEGQIEDLTSNGQCTVVFRHQKKPFAEVCLLELLKPIPGKGRNKGSSSNNFSAPGSSQASSSSAAGQLNKHTGDFRDLQKKKQQKRKDKVKELEEEREKDKNKWQNFANKVSKKKTGHGMKKSIFATPDSITGRVGIGTCGIGGKGMTEYQQKMEKVKKVSNFTLPKFSIIDEDGRAPQSFSKPPPPRNRFT